jgi:uncharacterized protein YukE
MSTGIQVRDLAKLRRLIADIKTYEKKINSLLNGMSQVVSGAKSFWDDDIYVDFKRQWEKSSSELRLYNEKLKKYEERLSGYQRDLEKLAKTRI